MRITLLLTSCIEPTQFKDSVKRNNIEQRLNDYLSAIDKWNNHVWPCEIRLIYVDNSGYSLEKIKNKINPNFQPYLLSYQAEPAPKGMHYGFSEIEMIAKVINIRELWRDDDWVIKVTGRLYFPEINKLINLLNSSNLFVCDVRSKRWNKSGQSYIPSSIFAFKVGFFNKYLLNFKSEMKELNKSHLELFLFYKIMPLIHSNKNKIIVRLPFNLNPVGVGAHWNKNYESRTERLIQGIRAILRKFTPFIWA
jgi:hypothetical protein